MTKKAFRTSAQRRYPGSGRVKRGVAIAVLTVSTMLQGTEAALAQASPTVQAGQAAAADQRKFFIQIGAGSLADALARFTAQTGIEVKPGSVKLIGLRSNGTSGSLTAADALRALLTESGLTFFFTSNDAVTLSKPLATIGKAVANVREPGGDPYADPDAPYKANRLSSSKFTESILDTPRTVTVLTKEALDDKQATSLREVARSTAGVTLGSGEGGNAFGDRFFIRGFDARNDVFVDGVRDPGVSIRENYDTEQVEILRGPASSFAGRGTTGGAINVATKQAGDVDFYRTEETLGFTDSDKRITLDINRAVNSRLDVRVNAMAQGSDIAGRDFTTDNRSGIAGALTYRPAANLTLRANYSHTYLNGIPDYGVPYDQVTKEPVTENLVARDTYYGFANRDFTKSIQDMGTFDAEWRLSDSVKIENKARRASSLLNYIGTIPENPSASGSTAPYSSTPTFFSGYTQLNSQSRYEPVQVFADQPQATFTFDTGSVHHTAIVGAEFSTEHISIDSYTGLTSELATGPVAFASSGAPIVSVFNPPTMLAGTITPTLTGNPLHYDVTTTAGYLMDTAKFGESTILNAGLRYDDYRLAAANNTTAQSARSGITSYNVGLTIKPMKTASIYIAYATAADPVGDELDATSSSYGGLAPTQSATQIFGPLLSRSIEAGTKWELFDQHLLASLALFQTNVDNARETAPANLPGYTKGQIVAGAAYRVNGVDFELAGNINKQLSIMGGIVLLNPKVTSSIVPTNIGLQLANIAPQSFNLLSKYKLTKWFELGGQGSYVSEIKGGSLLAANGGVAYPNPPNPTLLPSHWRFDTFAETKIGTRTELKFYVQNILNTTYYDSLYQSAQPFIMVAPGRSFSLIVSLKH